MEISFKRIEAPFRIEALDDEGHSLHIDASPSIGGQGHGFRPMSLLLAGLGGCSLIDVINILQKSRVDLQGIEAKVSGDREPDAVPSLFTKINVHYTFYGKIEESKAKRAIDLSLEKYCSVAKTLEKTAVITSSFEIVGN